MKSIAEWIERLASNAIVVTVLRPNPKKNMLYVAGVDYNRTLCPFQSRHQHIYHGEPYVRVDFILQFCLQICKRAFMTPQKYFSRKFHNGVSKAEFYADSKFTLILV